MANNMYEGRSIFDGKALRLTVEAGKISKVENIADSDKLPYLSPGFLDMQVNGFLGIDYSLEDLESSQVRTLVDQMAVSGTTKHVPTFVTMPHERFVRNLAKTVQAMKDDPHVANALSGFHIEGPFISDKDGPRGAHDRSYVRDPDFSLFKEWQDAAEGHIKYITVAPEKKGAIEFIAQVVESGVKVAIGHSGASVEEIHAAIKAGATSSTHLGNGSYTELPRLKNYIWEQLAADELYAGMICDSYHLPGSVVKVFARAKGLERLILVSDVALLGGFDPGVYKWGNLDVEVFDDGHLGIPGTSVLAGAAHLLDWDIARFMEYTGASLAETIKLCTAQPAGYLGYETKDLEAFNVGAQANLALFTYQMGDDRLNVKQTVLGSQEYNY